MNRMDFSPAELQWISLCGQLEGQRRQRRREKSFEQPARRFVRSRDMCRDGPEWSIVMSGGMTGLGILGRALGNMFVLVSTWEGDPRPTLTSNSMRCQGALPRMMLNTFDSNAKTFGSLMNQSNGSTHVHSGSTHGRRRISIATRDTVESLLCCSVPRWDETWVEESWMGESSAPRMQASTQSAQTTAYTEEEDRNDDGTNVEDHNMPDWSYSTSHPPSYNQVHQPESLWQPHYTEAYENKLETANELQHLGEFGMKPPYRFGTHKGDPLSRLYSKLDPNVLVIASNSVEEHHFLNQRHTHVVSKTRTCINDLREAIDMDSWRTTAPFRFGSMRAAPDTCFDKNRKTLAAHRATSGTPGLKRPIIIFDQLSSHGEIETRKLILGSGIDSKRTCPITSGA